MPEPGVLRALQAQITGMADGLFATSDDSSIEIGIGGGISVDGVWFLCPVHYTAVMLTVAAAAMRAGTQVTVNFSGDVITSIATPNFPNQ